MSEVPLQGARHLCSPCSAPPDSVFKVRGLEIGAAPFWSKVLVFGAGESLGFGGGVQQGLVSGC